MKLHLVGLLVAVSGCVELVVPDDAGTGGGGGLFTGGGSGGGAATGGGSATGGGGGGGMDAGLPDAGTPDAGTEDAGTPDAGPTCTRIDTEAHCGSCNHACGASQRCIVGACVQTAACSWSVRGAASPLYLNSGVPSAVVAGDFDEDGRQDLMVASSSGPLAYFRQTDAGLVEQAGPSGSAYGASDFFALDVNGDLHLDLVAGTASPVWLGAGNGTFRRPSPNVSFATPFWRIAVGDVDHDGFPELVGQVQDRLQLQAGSAGANGALAMLSPTAVSHAALALGDVTGDGFADLLTSTNNAGTWTTNVYAGASDRTFATMPLTTSLPYGSNFEHELLTCDVVAGGASEFIEFSQEGAGRVFTVSGSALTPLQTLVLGANAKLARCVDLDGDGDQDLVTSHYTTGSLSLRWSQNVGGQLSAPVTLLNNVAMGTLTIGDLDGDGVLDVAAAGSSNVQVLYGRCQ